MALACVVFCAYAGGALRAAPLGLDDASLIREFADAPFWHIFEYDHFGHLRPAKNLWFWWLAQHAYAIPLVRAFSVCAALAAAWAVRGLTRALGLSTWASAGAAIMWLLNPCTAAVTLWLSASNYTFAVAGLLGYLWLMLRWHEGATWPYLLAAHAALLFAVLHHELAFVAPVLFVLLRFAKTDLMPARSLWRRWAFAILALLLAAAMAALRSLSAQPALQYRMAARPASALFASSARYFFENLGLWFWPQHTLGVLLGDPLPTKLVANTLSWLALALLLFVSWRARSRERVLVFGAAWTLVCLAPIANFIPLGNTPVAVQYLALPSVGLAILVARALDALALRLPRSREWTALLASLALVIVWQPAFRASVRAFADTQALYELTLGNYPQNIEVRANLSALYLDQKSYAKAGALLDASLELAPEDLALIGNRLELYADVEDFEGALRWLDQHPQYVLAVPDARVRRGIWLLRLGRQPEAEETFREVLELSTVARDRYAAGYRLAIALVQQRKYAQAKQVLDEVVSEFPDEPDAKLAQQLVDGLLRDPN